MRCGGQTSPPRRSGNRWKGNVTANWKLAFGCPAMSYSMSRTCTPRLYLEKETICTVKTLRVSSCKTRYNLYLRGLPVSMPKQVAIPAIVMTLFHKFSSPLQFNIHHPRCMCLACAESHASPTTNTILRTWVWVVPKEMGLRDVNWNRKEKCCT